MQKMAYSFLTCLNCGIPNDIDFNYCKSCGKARETSGIQTQDRQETLDKINNRLKVLDNLIDSASYSKQKSSLKADLEKFLLLVDPQKNLTNATPDDIRKYLIFKEKGGKTQLHNTSCHFRGTHGLKSCECPRTLAYKSVDSLLGKIRALFRDEGRSGEWNAMLLTGNPASSHLLKRHQQAVSQEQAGANISVKQATPLMFNKLGKLCRHLSYRVTVEENQISKFLYARDLSYISILCNSGSRGSDLGLLTAEKCFEIPDSNGFFVSQTAGKIATLDNPRNFVVLPSKDSDICPVRNLKIYVSVAKELGVRLDRGYIFRIKDKESKQIVNQPVSSSCMSERLKLHLKGLNLYDGETSHSSRRGCAITLRMLGVSDEGINEHIGWSSNKMVNHYASIGRLFSPKSTASTLSIAAQNLGKGNSSFDNVAQKYSSLKDLKQSKLFLG